MAMLSIVVKCKERGAGDFILSRKNRSAKTAPKGLAVWLPLAGQLLRLSNGCKVRILSNIRLNWPVNFQDGGFAFSPS